MHLLWQIFRKDFTRLRLPLAIWSALQALALIGPVFVWSLTSLAAEQIRFAIYLFAGVQVLAWFAAFDFAIRLIQEDSPMRADAFWRTRPVSGPRLLTAKLFGLLLSTLLSAVPALLAITLFSSLSAASALLEPTLKTYLAIAVCAVPFATLTRSFRQCLLVSLGFILLTVVIFVGVHIIYDPTGTDLYRPRMTLIQGIALLTAFGVVVYQFIHNRLTASLRFASIGAVLAVFTATLWPWRFPLKLQSLPSRADEPAATRDIVLAYDKSQLWNEAEFWAPSLLPVLNIDFTISGFPSGYFLRPIAIHHHWLPDAVPSVRGAGGTLFPDSDARITLGVLPPASPPKSINIQSQIPEELAAILRARKNLPHYQADLIFDLHQAVVDEIPLDLGQTASTSHTDIRLLDIDPHTARVRIVERISHGAMNVRIHQFILYNVRTGTALRATGRESVSFTSLSQHDLSFAPIDGPNVTSRAVPLTADFLRDARLVKISFPHIGTLVRTVEVPTLQPRISR